MACLHQNGVILIETQNTLDNVLCYPSECWFTSLAPCHGRAPRSATSPMVRPSSHSRASHTSGFRFRSFAVATDPLVPGCVRGCCPEPSSYGPDRRLGRLAVHHPPTELLGPDFSNLHPC